MLIFSVFALDSNIDEEKLSDLINRISDSDMDALETLYNKTKTNVFSFAYSILKNKNDAEDITHDVYLCIYKSAKLYKKNDSPMGWIITITRNLSYRKLNKNKKTTTLNEKIFESRDNSDLSDEKIMLLDSINKLSNEESEIIVLHVVSGFKHDEIADILSIPSSTVRSKYRRALKKLKTELTKGGAFHE